MKIQVQIITVPTKYTEHNPDISTLDQLRDRCQQIAERCGVHPSKVLATYTTAEPLKCAKCGDVMTNETAELKAVPRVCKKCLIKK